jgi:hypothetical protein
MRWAVAGMAITLTASMAAVVLSLATLLQTEGHPWLNDHLLMLTGDCPPRMSTIYQDGHGNTLRETCEEHPDR